MAFEDDVRDLVARCDHRMAIPETDLLAWLKVRLARATEGDGWCDDCARRDEMIDDMEDELARLKAELADRK